MSFFANFSLILQSQKRNDMRLFFDSGATKCDCIVLDGAGRCGRDITEQGINASYMTDEGISAVFGRLRAQFPEGASFEGALFSGAGCGNASNAERVRSQLLRHFECREAEVVSDLEGSSRLLAPAGEALVAILGTGASACRSLNGNIACQAPSLGFWLGDEGSGTHLGKCLIQKYLRNEMPARIRADFEQKFSLDRTSILQRVYREANPNIFLSSFSIYIAENQKDEFFIHLLLRSFSDFFENQVRLIDHYRGLPLHLMGSVAYHFQDFIREAARPYEVTLGTVVQSPLSFLLQKRESPL